jgi:hypothetical protein
MEFDASWQVEDVSSTLVDPRAWGVREKKYIRVLDNILTRNECERLIALAEGKGFEAALVNIGGGRQKMMTDVRNNDRAIIDSPDIMEFCWQRILAACQDTELLNGPYGPGTHAVGLNERMRILRYDPGTYFAPHCDGCYIRSNEAGPDRRGERSFVTAQLYLNDGFTGGSTRFLHEWDETQFYDVVPKAGSVLLFQHDLYHEGSLLVEGRKYALRTDVMYTDKGPGHEYSVRPLPSSGSS